MHTAAPLSLSVCAEVYMAGFESLLQKRVALIDRRFVINEGRIVYPTAEGVLVACDDKTLTIVMGNDPTPMTFMVGALRAIRELPAAAEAPAPAEQAE
jgi:hypothetical protein